jgi:hypothetical protein
MPEVMAAAACHVVIGTATAANAIPLKTLQATLGRLGVRTLARNALNLGGCFMRAGVDKSDGW